MSVPLYKGSLTAMALQLMYITNDPQIALIAESCGVDMIWIDLETLGKEERQKGINSVKSHHTVSDIARIKPLLTASRMLVRINPWNEGSIQEVENVLAAGADIIMLPMWKTVGEVRAFSRAVGGRCKTMLLLETKEAVEILDEVLSLNCIDEVHIGLNDLHLSYGMSFMFQLLADGTVERLCSKLSAVGVPYGFGGVAKLGGGMLPAEKVITEHYRLGSTRAILSRSFCDCAKIGSYSEIREQFENGMKALRSFENSLSSLSPQEFELNRKEVISCVDAIVKSIKDRQ